MTKKDPYWAADKIKEWIDAELRETYYQSPSMWLQHGTDVYRARRWPSGRYEVVDITTSKYTDMNTSEFAAFLAGFWKAGSISGFQVDNNNGMDLRRERTGQEEV